MKRIAAIVLLFLIIVMDPLGAQDIRDFAFPGGSDIEGFGFDARGGTGGKIIRVTNLNAEGKGSLKEAIGEEGPRIVVFEVGGIIDLSTSVLRVENPFITIAGQTAPDPGITIIKGGISITTHEVIIQHIRVRPGEAGHAKKSGWEVDGIATSGGAYNVVIDHCSVSWATDENISASGPRFEGDDVEDWRRNTSHKILISNCIIAEGLSNSTHAKGEHSKGTLIHDNATEIAVVGNLYSCNVRRNPYFKGGAQGIVVNNYVYNPGRSVVHYGLISTEWEGHEWVRGKMVVEGNVFEHGESTLDQIKDGTFRGPVDVFWQDNVRLPGGVDAQFAGSYTLLKERPVWPRGFSVMDPEDVRDHALQHAGARPWNRDVVDLRIVQQARDKSGRIIDSEQEVGGYPVYEPVFKRFLVEDWDMDRILIPKQ
jgi:pectate lyase